MQEHDIDLSDERWQRQNWSLEEFVYDTDEYGYDDVAVPIRPFIAEACLLGGLGVAGAGMGQPQRALGVVDAVPDAAAGRVLVLPLFHLDAVDNRMPMWTPQRMLACVATTRIADDRVPRSPRVGGRIGTQLIPSLCCKVVRKPKIPSVRTRWRRNAFSTLGHAVTQRLSARRARNTSAVRDLNRTRKGAEQIRIGVDLRGGLPLVQELRHGLEIPD